MNKIIQLKDSEGNVYPKTIDVYSTDEVKTNKKWIDGKPIYRKIISNIQITSSNMNINVTNFNIDRLIYLIPYYEGIGGATGDFNADLSSYYISSTDYRRTFFRKVGNVYTLEYRGVGNGIVTFILEYTKTTD